MTEIHATIKVGTKVTYRDMIGRSHTAVVVYVDDDIKNGRPGVDLDNGGWCYFDQIMRIW